MHLCEKKKDGCKDSLTLPRMNTWLFNILKNCGGFCFLKVVREWFHLVFSEIEFKEKSSNAGSVEVAGVTIPASAYDEGKLTITIKESMTRNKLWNYKEFVLVV